MSTRRYLIVKVLQAVLTLAFVLAFNFFLFRGLGDPIQLLAKQRGQMTPQALADLKTQLGLDLPAIQQFVHYIRETLTGHLGYTFDNQPVSTVIAAAIWPTVLLIGSSTIASILLGVWIGIAQGWRWGSKFDQSMQGVTLAGRDSDLVVVHFFLFLCELLFWCGCGVRRGLRCVSIRHLRIPPQVGLGPADVRQSDAARLPAGARRPEAGGGGGHPLGAGGHGRGPRMSRLVPTPGLTADDQWGS